MNISPLIYLAEYHHHPPTRKPCLLLFIRNGIVDAQAFRRQGHTSLHCLPFYKVNSDINATVDFDMLQGMITNPLQRLYVGPEFHSHKWATGLSSSGNIRESEFILRVGGRQLQEDCQWCAVQRELTFLRRSRN